MSQPGHQHHLSHASSSVMVGQATGNDLSTAEPLTLPPNMNRNTFYMSPVANPDLVLALIIPGHPLYSGHDLPSSPSESILRDVTKTGAKVGGAISHFFASASNTVTNTAASAVGVKNQLALNKPKLKLVPRAVISTPQQALAHLNQKWLLSKEDGCIYSCVEEKDGGGSFYRLGQRKNQMIRVKAKDALVESGIGVSIKGGEHSSNAVSSPNPAHDPPSTTHNSLSGNSNGSGSSNSTEQNTNMISVTTATGGTVFCPLKWDVQAPVKGDQLRGMINIGAIHVVVEDTEYSSGNRGGLNRTSSVSGNGKPSAVLKDSSKLLMVKNICCSNLDCELEKIEEGSPCGFRTEAEAQVTMVTTDGSTPVTPGVSSSPPTMQKSSGLNLKQVWRVESDFSIWLSTLSRAVSTEYNLTRKLQKIEEARKLQRESTPILSQPTPMKLTIDYEYSLVWSTEGTKAANEVSIWRPKFPAGASYFFFGDYAHGSIKLPSKRESLVVASGPSGSLHRGLVRPIDFTLVWKKEKGKNGYLWIWQPVGPPGVDALALGHVAVCGKKEEKPKLDCGVVLVLRECLQDTGHSLSTPIWLDANLSGGAPGSLWSAKHAFTFWCNPNSHQPPSGSYYALLDPSSTPERAPLLRPMEPSNSSWEPIWDDRMTGAKMDVSIWRPMVDHAYVRFGDIIVRGHEQPKGLAVVAKDHPAFARPKGYKQFAKLYRGTRKCYVFQPIPPDDDHVALGMVVSASKEDPPSLDCIRCVHKQALIPLGVLKQMWIEHHNGMMATLSLGMTNFINLSKDGVLNVLWKNRSLNTFLIVQNSHARPDGLVYRLTMTESELQHTVQNLEVHARWVLESFFKSLSGIESVLKESGYKRLSITPRQCATIFSSIKGICKYMRDSDGDSSAFSLSDAFIEFLKDYEQTRMRPIYSTFKRYLYQTISEDPKDHDNTLELLDDNWSLLQQMTEVSKQYDGVEQWEPKLVTTRFVGAQTKPLITILMDEHIGREIFERFLEAFPPRGGKGMVDDEQDDEDDAQGGVTPNTPAIGAGGVAVPALQRQGSSPAASEAADAQRLETTKTLELLSKFSSELDAVIGITDQMEIRKLYLEYYQNYLTHTIAQEFPVRGTVARSAATGSRLGMSSILAVVSWISTYIELVEQDLLEGSRSSASEILQKMDDLVDKFMDVHDEHAKEKILSWISNILRQEEKASVELNPGGEEDTKKNVYYFTSGPSDLFLNINTLFDSQSANLTGRPLARIALMYVHVLTYYQQIQGEFFKSLRAVRDGTTFETVKGKTTVPVVKHEGKLDKPYSFILAQVNNARLYQANVDELGDKVLQRLGADDAPDELVSSLEDAFAQCNEEFATLGLGATEVLIRHIGVMLEHSMSQVGTEKVWMADPEYFQTAIIDELDELCSNFVPNLEGNMYATHLLQASTKHLVRRYLRAFLMMKTPLPLQGDMTGTKVAERIRADRQAITEYCSSIKRYDVLTPTEKALKQLDLLADFLEAESDFLKLHVSKIAPAFADMNASDITPATVTAHLLALRAGDVPADDRKLWLAPYAVELKQIEEAKKAALHQQKFSNLLSNKPASAQVSQATMTASLGSTPYGLEIFLHRGIDLVVKDSTTSDPYVNILLLDVNGARLDKRRSRVIEKNLNPVWEEAFTGFRQTDVSALHRLRFECFDKDFIGKDFMGHAEVTLEEIRNKQLLDRKAAVSRTSVSQDYTQTPLSFHLKLEPLEGRQNAGSDKVSGFLDVRIKYFKLSGASSSSTPVPAAAAKGKGAASDELDFDLDHQGQTGSKRPPPQAEHAGAGSAAPMDSPTAEASHTVVPITPHPQDDRSSDALLKEIETCGKPEDTGGKRWDQIVGTIKLGGRGASVTPKRKPQLAITGNRAPGRTASMAGNVSMAAFDAMVARKKAEAAVNNNKKTLRKAEEGSSAHDFFGLV